MKTDINRGKVKRVYPSPGRGQRVDKVEDDLYRQALSRQELLERYRARTEPASVRKSRAQRFLDYWRSLW